MSRKREKEGTGEAKSSLLDEDGKEIKSTYSTIHCEDAMVF